MNDNELRTRLNRLDPQATAPVDPITSLRAQHLLEYTMTATDTTKTTETSTSSTTRAWPLRHRVLSATVAAAAVAITAGVLLIPTVDSTPVPAKKTTLALSLPDSTTLASCIPFDVAILKGFPVAFAARVTSVGSGTVTLEVTHWYAGGTAQVVTMSTPGANTSVALDSATFENGKDYLVSATDGTVTSCGYSGRTSPTLQQAYTTAFGG